MSLNPVHCRITTNYSTSHYLYDQPMTPPSVLRWKLSNSCIAHGPPGHPSPSVGSQSSSHGITDDHPRYVSSPHALHCPTHASFYLALKECSQRIPSPRFSISQEGSAFPALLPPPAMPEARLEGCLPRLHPAPVRAHCALHLLSTG